MRVLVRVWDAPTRLFHWVLTLAVVGLVVSAELGELVWHFRLGYAVLVLLMFRLVWGLVGGHWSRFVNFLYHPRQMWQYLRGGDTTHWVGHNPVGSLSVYALLGFLLLQTVSGLFSDDEIANSGPLTRFASGDWVSNATWYHKDIGQYILMALVALHVTAIVAYYLKKRENLVRPMITGDKTLDFPAVSSADEGADRLKALVIVAACTGAVLGGLSWLE